MSGRFTLISHELTELARGSKLKSPLSETSDKNASPNDIIDQTNDELVVKSLLSLESPLEDPQSRFQLRQRFLSLFGLFPSTNRPQSAAIEGMQSNYSLSRPMSTRGGSSLQLLTADKDCCVAILLDSSLPPSESPSSVSSSSYCSIIKSPNAPYR